MKKYCKYILNFLVGRLSWFQQI